MSGPGRRRSRRFLLLNPQKIILGGAVPQVAQSLLMEPLMLSLRQRAFFHSVHYLEAVPVNPVSAAAVANSQGKCKHHQTAVAGDRGEPGLTGKRRLRVAGSP